MDTMGHAEIFTTLEYFLPDSIPSDLNWMLLIYDHRVFISMDQCAGAGYDSKGIVKSCFNSIF